MQNRKNEVLARRIFYKGDIIINQGDMGTNGYVIHQGQVEVFLSHEGKNTSLAILGPGEVIGEMGVLFNEHRSASVRALTDCDLIVLDREGIMQNLDMAAPSIRAMLKIFSERLRRTNKRVTLEDENTPDETGK